jgi:hypothetical protein
MQITINEDEYQELMRVKREYEFITRRLYSRIRELRKESDKLNKTSFVTNDGDSVQNIEWVKLRYEISDLLYYVPDEALEELLK